VTFNRLREISQSGLFEREGFLGVLDDSEELEVELTSEGKLVLRVLLEE